MSWSDAPFVAVLVAWQGLLLFAYLRHKRAPEPRHWRELLLLPVITCFHWSLQHKAEYPWAPYLLVAAWGVLLLPTLRRVFGDEPTTRDGSEEAS